MNLARLPTKHGDFKALAFGDDLVLIKGDVVGKENVLVRMHSECLTGDALGSLRCDCGEQLEVSMKRISEEGEGVLVYLRQEGRGIGLANKMEAYILQDKGLDTVEANHALGFKDDEREYSKAADILSLLSIKSIRLMTNNPRKREGLEKHAIVVSKRIPSLMQSNEHNVAYLKTKKEKMGHEI